MLGVRHIMSKPDVNLFFFFFILLACDVAITESGEFLDSFNYPDSYDANQQCSYSITNPEGCVRITLLLFSLDDGDSVEVGIMYLSFMLGHLIA